MRGVDRRTQRIDREIADIAVVEAIAPGPAGGDVKHREAFAGQ
jgi:hypothetical protein